MTLATFTTDLGLLAPRGNSISSSVKTMAIKMGIRFIEDAHTFEHMGRYAEFDILYQGDYPRTVSQPVGLKEVEFMRLVRAASGDYKYLEEVDPRDITNRRTGEPNGYWRDGKEYFWLDSTPDQDYEAEIGYTAYTVLPADDSLNVWILENMYEVCLASCGAALSILIKDRKMREEFVATRDELLQAAINSDINAGITNSEFSMQYRADLNDKYNQDDIYGNR